MNIKIMVVGDIISDLYLVGSVNRISPELPAPIFNIEQRMYIPGGAANVVRSLKNIGVQVFLFSAREKGFTYTRSSEEIINSVYQNGKHPNFLLLPVKDKLPIKTRFFDKRTNSYISLRVDEESTEDVSITHNDIYALKNNLNAAGMKDLDLIIVSDYAKGFITDDLVDVIKDFDVPIIVDPKPSNVSLYNDIFAMCPNSKELAEMKDYLYNKNIRYIIETMGQNGINLYKRNEYIDFNNSTHIKFDNLQVPVYDVIGAGDAFIAIMGTCIAMGESIEDSIRVADGCAARSVSTRHTSFVTKEIFNEIYRKVAKN